MDDKEKVEEQELEQNTAGNTAESHQSVDETTQADSSSAKAEESAQQTEARAENNQAQNFEKKRSVIDDLKRERSKRRELQSELQMLKEQVGRLAANSQVPDQVKKVAEKLGIDEESARKFVEVNRELNGQKETSSRKEIDEQQYAANFQNQVQDLMEEYDDWDAHKLAMQEEFVKEYSKNPMTAWNRGPEYFYLKAKASQVKNAETARKQGQAEMASKLNNKNLAATESRGSSVKPNLKPGLTLEAVSKMSLEQYQKRLPEINEALRTGRLK